MLKVHPDLWVEWDFEKNNELKLDIWKLTKGSGKDAWWICPKCKSSYDMRISSRGKMRRNCPYCAGKKVNHTNSLASLNPELASEWHPTLNGDLTPYDIASNTIKRAWWLGKCRHNWEASVVQRNVGSNCPYCSGKKLLTGFNDMWTTNPELAKLLANPDDGYKYMQSSKYKVDWKSPCCGEIIKNKVIGGVRKNGLICPACSDGVSFSERIMYNLLKALKITFIKEVSKFHLDWIVNRRYDYYLPLLNTIIELHGGQHYSNSRFNKERTLEFEQTNDRFKYELAIQNGIKPENYIVIDCRYSVFEFIKINILNSRLAEVFDLSNIDWNEIEIISSKSLVVMVWELWDSSQHNTLEISKMTHLSEKTIIKYLYRGNKLNKCTYSSKINKERFSYLKGAE